MPLGVSDVLGVSLVEQPSPPPMMRRLSSLLGLSQAVTPTAAARPTDPNAIYQMMEDSNRKLSTNESTGKFIYEVCMTVVIFYSCLSIPFLLAFQPITPLSFLIVGAVIGKCCVHGRRTHTSTQKAK